MVNDKKQHHSGRVLIKIIQKALEFIVSKLNITVLDHNMHDVFLHLKWNIIRDFIHVVLRVHAISLLHFDRVSLEHAYDILDCVDWKF